MHRFPSVCYFIKIHQTKIHIKVKDYSAIQSNKDSKERQVGSQQHQVASFFAMRREGNHDWQSIAINDNEPIRLLGKSQPR